MDHVFENIVDILVAVVIMFLFPLLYFGLRQDTITQNVLYADTSNLVDTVSTKGYITKDMYETYLKEVDSTQVLGDIQLEHEELALEPEYRFKTSDEVIAEQNSTFGGTNVYTYVPVTTDIPYVIDPIDNSGLTMNTETNASVISGAVNLLASPSHVHTDECYPGAIKHTHTGNSTSGGGCYGGENSNTYWVDHIHNKYCYTQETCGGSFSADTDTNTYKNMHCKNNTLTVYVLRYVCNKCGYSTYTSPCIVYYKSCTCGWSEDPWNSDPGTCTQQETKLTCNLGSGYWNTDITYYINCGKTEGVYYNGNTLVEPSCNSIISSITPTNPTQTLYLNDPLITTVKVTYNDGSTKTVEAISNFTPNTIVQNKIVTLSYGGLTQNITVTFIPKTKTCINGHTYNLNADGSDPGCCYCNSWLSKLEVINPSTKEITIYKGTTLEENGVVLKATYMNDRTEMLVSGYANNLDRDYVGVQTVTISYKGKYATIKVTSKRNLIQCSKCGKYYELYSDGSDPGCPFCASLIPVFTGNVMKHYTNFYTNDLLKELMEGSGIHYFKEGDYFNIQVANKAKTLGTKLISTIMPNVSKNSINVECGGVIRDDVRVK